MTSPICPSPKSSPNCLRTEISRILSSPAMASICSGTFDSGEAGRMGAPDTSLVTTSTSSLGSIGFVRTSFIPARKQASISVWVAAAVKPTIGTAETGPSIALIVFVAVIPSMTGICRSIRIKSKNSLSAISSRASLPFSATIVSEAIFCMMPSAALRLVRLSSTSKTRGANTRCPARCLSSMS